MAGRVPCRSGFSRDRIGDRNAPRPRVRRGPVDSGTMQPPSRAFSLMADSKKTPDSPVTQAQAEAAVRTLLRWAGEDPDREGLLDTPRRVAEAYGDWFSGYQADPREYLERTFEEVAGYDELIVLRDI